MARCLIIGNPENRRVSLFQEALGQAGLKPARVLAYQDLLAEPARLSESLSDIDVVRIESPGENFAVTRHILALGGLENAMELPEELGRIHSPGIWFAGFSRLMARIRSEIGALACFNHPDDIVTMFNKPQTKRLLQKHALPSLPEFSCFDQFFDFVKQQRQPRFFIKLNYSSSASGIVAYTYNPKSDQHVAYSTVAIRRTASGNAFYNSLKIQKYTDHTDIERVLDFLFAQGALVESWIPKAQHRDSSFDLRIVAIAGRRCHAIARLSRSPMTNLHLGNQRCSADVLGINPEMWQKIDLLVADSLQVFPRSLYAGLDVVLPRNGKDPILLEANAFGDLLPNLFYQGKTTHQCEIEALWRRQGWCFGTEA